MPTCCILHCSGEKGKKSQLWLHNFPKNKHLKQKWIDIIGPENINFEKELYLCFSHFEDACFYEMGGRLRLFPNSVPSPTLLPMQNRKNNIGESQISDLEVCRTCLAVDCNLISMDDMLQDAFEQLTGIELQDGDLPTTLCVECAHRLRSCTRFRQKCHRADTLMMDIIKKKNQLTAWSINSIDRQMYDLTSSLSFAHYGMDHFDLYISESEQLKPEDEDVSMHDENAESEVKLFEENDGYASVTDEMKIEVEYLPPDDDKYLVVSCDDAVDSQAEYFAEVEKSEKVLKEEDDFEGVDEQFADDYETHESEKIDDDFEDDNSPKRRKVGTENGRKSYKLDALKELFTVIEVRKLEDRIEEFKKRATTISYKGAKLKCSLCYKGFSDGTAYKTHMARHTSVGGEHSCPVCSIRFNTKHYVWKHVAAHHTFKFMCKLCPYETTNKQSAALHAEFHKGMTYVCPHCPEQYKKRSSYLGHLRLRHPSDFVCRLCGFSFVSEKGIHQHTILKHILDDKNIPENGPWCQDCNIQFANREALAKHKECRHGTRIQRPFVRKTLRPKREIEMEKERRDTLRKEKKEIECEQCGKLLPDARTYYVHFKTMHPDKNRTNYDSLRSQYMCEVCGGIYASQAHLREHSDKHRGERTYKCKLCEKAFVRKQYLIGHMKLHSDNKPSYDCDMCDKRFTSKGNVRRHIHIAHTGLKPYTCELCGKGFLHPCEKKAHIGYIHLKKPWPKRIRNKKAKQEQSSSEQYNPTGGQDTDIPQTGMRSHNEHSYVK